MVRWRQFFAAAAMLLLAFSSFAYAEDACTLVEDGRARAVIVLAEKPTRVARMAAAELAHYVKKITGAELPVVAENELTAEQSSGFLVLVGQSARTEKLGLTSAGFERQQHLIRNEGKWLILMGRDEQDFGPADYTKDFPWPECRLDFPHRVYFKAWGSFYAVDTFLERVCSVRWYMPGELGEVAPKRSTIATRGLNLKLKPWTKFRVNTRPSSWDPFDFYIPGRTPKKMIPRRDMLLWWLRMKMGGDPWQVNHSVYSYYRRFGKEHPDWFANGKPTPRGHLCYTNPGFIKQHAKDACDYFDGKFPKMVFPKGGRVLAAGDYYPAVPIDSSSGWCTCKRCKPLLDVHQPVPKGIPGAEFFNGYYSEYVWSFAAAVAREVRKTHPDKWISTIAYARYFLPPKHVKLEPNMSVTICRSLMLYAHPASKKYFNDAIRAWHERVGEISTWEYYLNQYFNGYMAFPWITPHMIAEDIAFLKTVGMVGRFVEISGWKGRWANPAEDYLPVYVTFKLLADDSRGIDEILDEHYRLFYGPAAAPMKAFFEQFERDWRDPKSSAKGVRGQRRSWEVVCPPAKLRIYNDHIQKALALATEKPYSERVRLMFEAVYKPMEKHCLAYAARAKSRKRLACPTLAKAPVIDGKLDDGAWKKAARTTPFVGVTMENIDVDTVALVGRDAENLYVAFRCPEPEMDKIKADQNTPDTTMICLDDDVEIFIDVGRTRQKYYHFLINSNGVFCDRAVGFGLPAGGVSWNSGAKVAAHRGDAEWTVEAAIPLKAMKAALKGGEVWGFNACRSRRGAVKTYRGQNSCWSPTFGGFNSPDEFGTLVMAGTVGANSGGNDGDAPSAIVEIAFEDEIKKDLQKISTGAGMTIDGKRATATATLRRMGKKSKPWEASLRVKGKSGFGYAFKRDAARYIELKFPDEFAMDTDDFTIMFWFKTSLKESQFLFSSTTTAPLYILELQQFKKRRLARFIFAVKPPSRVAWADAPPADGLWHHIAVTVDRGGRALVYVDGEKPAKGALDISAQKGKLHLQGRADRPRSEQPLPGPRQGVWN